MKYLCSLCVVCVTLIQLVSAHYTRQWAVHIDGGPEVADAVARDHGFVNLGQVGFFYDFFLGWYFLKMLFAKRKIK